MMEKSLTREKEITYVLQGCPWHCAVEKSTVVCALVAFWIAESCAVSCWAPSCQLQCSPMSSSANGPLARAATQWWQEWIHSLRPCLVRPLHCLSLPVLTLLWWIDEVPCYTWPPTTWVPDAPFLSVVVRRLAPRGQRFRNEISFDRLLPEQIE